MTLTPRGERVVIGFVLIVALALGMFFPWESMPWNNYPPNPHDCPAGVVCAEKVSTP